MLFEHNHVATSHGIVLKYFSLKHARDLPIISLREKKRRKSTEGEESPSPRETLDQSN